MGMAQCRTEMALLALQIKRELDRPRSEIAQANVELAELDVSSST
jgi:hypothetical protein